MSHTPGPWAWQKFGEHYYLAGQYGSRPVILGTLSDDHQACLTNFDAKRDMLWPLRPEHPDSRLIAAAPALLAACKVLLPHAKTLAWVDEFSSKDVQAAVEQAKAAIAQAE